MREWRRTIGQDIVDSEEESSRAAGVEGIAQTIAAYFEMHDFSSTTGLIAGEMDHVRTIYVFYLPLCLASSRRACGIKNDRELTMRPFLRPASYPFRVFPFFFSLDFFLFPLGAQVDDACSLATMGALSFDAEQANKAEWYTSYPKVRRSALSKQAVQRAEALPKPPHSESAGKGALRHLDARGFSAFAGVTCGAVGSGRAAMSMIADIARQEIEWQLHIMQPLRVHIGLGTDVVDANSDADSAQRRRRKSGSRVRTRSLLSVLVAEVDEAGVPAAHEQRGSHMAGKKRKRSTAADVAGTPDSPRYPPEKRAKRGSVAQHSQHLHPHDRGAGAAAPSGTRGAINVPLERPLTPPAGPAAAFLYSLGTQQGTMEITLERGRGMRGAGRRR